MSWVRTGCTTGHSATGPLGHLDIHGRSGQQAGLATGRSGPSWPTWPLLANLATQLLTHTGPALGGRKIARERQRVGTQVHL